jgi:hypothetical protein
LIRAKSAVTSNQRAAFQAHDRFSTGLFQLLQECARTAPLSPKPLKGIYNWYLQRDSVITQNGPLERKSGVDKYVVIELSNGQELRVPRSLLEASRADAIEALFQPHAVKRAMAQIAVEPVPEVAAAQPPRKVK